MEDISEQDALPAKIIDIRAKKSPDRTFVFLPKGQNLEDGFYPFTYAALAKAIDATAWWLDSALGGRVTGDEFPVIPYIGLNDARYLLLVFASVKTHRNLMVPLSHNTPEAQARLLKHSNCNTVLASKEHVHSFDPARAAIENLRLVQVPELSELIHDGPVDHYPYTKTTSEALADPLWTIQTSGTTGNPQPLMYTNATVLFQGSSPDVGDYTLAQSHYLDHCQYTNLLPFSWGVGLQSLTIFPLLAGSITTLLPATMPQPMTAEYVVELTKWVPRGSNNGAIFVPDTLRALARDSQRLKSLAFFDWVGFAGAPLDLPTGNLVAAHTRVQSYIGSTDIGTYPVLLSDPSDWHIFRFHPSHKGFYLEPFQDDLYELCASRLPDDPRPGFLKDPTLQVFRTKDLWRKVPGREAEGFWTTAGRIDDFVKLANLTRFNAIEIEQVLDRHPEIVKSLVAGDARPRPFAIVQIKEDVGPAATSTPPQSREAILSRIWSAFEEANARTLPSAHLTRALTVIAAPGKPLKRTAKATVDRRNTIKLYEREIEEAYARVAAGQSGSGA